MADLATPGATSQPPHTRLAELKTLASAKEAIKDYDAAADLYSQAAELESNLNGEMALENADILYSYGKCLYHLAVSKSDVLGSKTAVQNATESGGNSGRNATTKGPQDNGAQTERPKVENAAPPKTLETTKGSRAQDESNKQPLFQFNGDENFDDSDDDDDEGAHEDAGDNDNDDFGDAFETLDMARVLFLRKLEKATQPCQDGENTGEATEARKLKERVADIYDLQAEISLEGERFSNAVTDLQASLALKEELFPLEDSALAECHYKLSLALEFASITQPDAQGEDKPAENKTSQVDEKMRADAAAHMETAIRSCKLRISAEEKKLAPGGDIDEREAAKLKRSIKDVKEIVSDMEQRLTELRRPPISVTESVNATEGANINSILNLVQGQSAEGQAPLLENIMKQANDLNALVKKRKRPAPSTDQAPDPESSTNKQPKT